MRRWLIYVAGPFRGANAWAVEQNIRRAETEAFHIAETYGHLGAVPVIPHTLYRFWDGTLTAEFWLEATLEIVRRCDAIYMLEDWQDSEGSKGERAEADRLGLPVFEQALEDSVGSEIFEWLTNLRKLEAQL